MTDERINEKFKILNDRLELVEQQLRTRDMAKLLTLYNDIQNIKLALNDIKDVAGRRDNSENSN